MATPQNKIGPTHSWREAPKPIRLGLINVYKEPIPQLVGLTIHLLTKFQILALYFKFSYAFLPVETKSMTIFTNIISNVLNCKDLFKFTEESFLARIAFVVLHLYNFLLMVMMLFLFIQIARKRHIDERFQSFWAIVIYIHTLILLFPSFNFSVSSLIYWTRGNLAIFRLTSTNEVIVPILSFLTIFWNGCLVIFSKVVLLTSLQATSPLHMKTNTIQRMEIFEKCLLFLLVEAMTDTETSSWVILIISFVIIVFKNVYTFHCLPYYDIQVQTNDIIMNSLLFTLAILNLIARAIMNTKHSLGSSEVIWAWLLFSPFAAKYVWNRLQSICSTLLRVAITDTTPEHLLHRVPLYRYYLKTKININLNADKMDFLNLYITGKNQIMRPYVKDTGEQVSFDLNTRQHFKVYSLSLLRDGVKLHSDHWSLKVAYIRTLTEYAYYVQALYVIEQTRRGVLSPTQVMTLHLLKADIEKVLRSKYLTLKPTKINTLAYLQSNYMYDQLRNEILRQIQKQQAFWLTCAPNKVDFKALVDLSNKIEFKKLKLQKFWSRYESGAEENFVSPYLTYGVYLELVNYRAIKGTELINQYMRKAIAVERIFSKDELSNETMFASDNVCIEISGIKEDIGTILDCSSSMKKVFGFTREHVIGVNTGIIVPDWLKDKHNSALFRFYETGTKTVLNHTRQVLATTAIGFLLPVHIHVRLNPFLENKISYVGLLRPIKQQRNCFLVMPDGTIDGVTTEIAVELNIPPNTKVNIFDICPDFKIISDVTNKVAHNQITTREDFEMLFIDLKEVNKRNRRRHKQVSRKSTILEDSSPKSPTSIFSDRKELLSKRSDVTPTGKSINGSYSKFSRQKSGQNLDYETCIKLYHKYKEEGIEVTLHCLNQNQLTTPFEFMKQLKALIRVENMIVGQEWTRLVSITNIVEKKSEHPQYHRKSVIKLMEIESQHSLPSKHDGEKTRKYQQIIKKKDHGASAFSRLKISSQSSIEGDYPEGSSPFKQNSIKQNSGETFSPVKSPRFVNEVSRGSVDKRSPSSLRLGYKVTLNSEGNTSPGNKAGTLNNHQGIRAVKLETDGINPSEMESSSSNESEQDSGTKEKKEEKNQNEEEGDQPGKDIDVKRINQQRFKDVEGPASSYGRTSEKGLELKIKKGVEAALECQQKSKKFTYFTIAFIFCMIMIAIVLLAQMIVAINAFDNISDQNQIITLANLRLDALVFSNFLLRVWYIIIEGKAGYIPEPYYTSEMEAERAEVINQVDYLSTTNLNLITAVSLIEENLQNDFYDRNVRVYDVDNNGNPTDFTMANTFTAIDKILSEAFKFLSAETFPMNQTNQDMLYFLYNCYNDLYVSNENSVAILREDLANKISTYERNVWGVSASVLAVLLLFLLSSLMIIRELRKSVYKFGAFFFRISNADIKTILNSLNNLHKALANNYQDDALLTNLNVVEERVKVKEDQMRGRADQKNIVYNGYHLQNQLLALRLWPLVLLVLGLVLGFSGMKLNDVSHITWLRDQGIASGNNLINSNLAVSILVEIIGANLTTTFANEPILDQFYLVLNNLSQTEALVNTFRDNKGNIETNKAELLLNFSCTAHFEDEGSDFEDLCNNVTAYQGYTSIVSLNNLVWQVATNGIERFIGTNRTAQDQTNAFLYGNGQFRNIITLERQLNSELWSRVLADFQAYLDSQTTQTILFSIYFEILILFITLSAFPWALTKLNGKDYELKKMLKLMPLNIILKNRWLKAYLVNHCNHILDTLKNVI